MSNDFNDDSWIRLTSAGKEDRGPLSTDPNLARGERVIKRLLRAAGDEGMPYELLIKLAVAVDELVVEELQLYMMSTGLSDELTEDEDDDVQP